MIRVLVIATLIAAFAGSGGVALAQPAPPRPMPRQPNMPVPAQVQPKRVPAPPFAQPGPARAGVTEHPAGVSDPHYDKLESDGQGMALVFWLFALITVGGALFVITRRNLIAAVMGMVGAFVGIAAVYMMLYASFLAVLQMLVYAGAIMVLFVFVIMILNRPEDEPVAPSGRAGGVLGGIAIIYLVARLGMVLVHVTPPDEHLANQAPAQVQLAPTSADEPGELVAWGSVKAVGNDLFGPGLFPFEAISILLLVAVVGAIAIARPLKEVDAETGGDGP
ncbi:MAG TPA: NADH-quinone oxidoreductase subunit J [Kofleriaceae bacterium]